MGKASLYESGGMAEWDYGDGLENRCGGNLTGGSNPSPSAKPTNTNI